MIPSRARPNHHHALSPHLPTSHISHADYYYVSAEVQFSWAGGFVCAVLAVIGLCTQPWFVLVIRWRQRRLLDPEDAAADDEPAGFAYATYVDTGDGGVAVSAVDQRDTSESQAFLDGEAAGLCSRGDPSLDSDHSHPGSLTFPVAASEPEDRQALYVNSLF